MMRHDRNEPTNERLDRYAEAAVELLGLNVLRAHDRMVSWEMAEKFMALADTEQTELRAGLARVEALADEWHARGERVVAHSSKKVPNDCVAARIYEAGCEMVENARKVRAALKDPS